MTLLELAERCEQATAPDRELDILIALGLPSWTYAGKSGHFYNAGPRYEGADDRIGFLADDDSRYLPGNAPDMLVPEFTASLDAAMTLVPEGHDWLVRSDGAFANVSRKDATNIITISGDWKADGFSQGHRYADAATPALALCAAALRARASDAQ